jgi:hypothetical protein
MRDSLRRPRLIAVAVAVTALAAAESWLLFGKRSGEVAYAPSAAEMAPSLEVYGDTALSQTFVPGADGLESLTIYPARAGTPTAGVAEVVLDGEGEPIPLARVAVPATRLATGEAWTWHVPRIEQSAGRRFTLTIRVPAAARGQGLRFVIGPPAYRWGELRVGGRPQWGDLKFETRAARARTIDTLRQLRRSLPWPFSTDGALVLAFLLLNGALAIVCTQLAKPD